MAELCDGAIYDERRIGDYIAAKEIANREKMEFELDDYSAEHETSHAARRMPSCCFLSSFSRGSMYTVKIAAIFALIKKRAVVFLMCFDRTTKIAVVFKQSEVAAVLIHGSNKSENQKEKTNSPLNSQPLSRSRSTSKG